jgi:hypothetical protein
MRSAYYQNPGNPVQLDRLPADMPSTIEVPAPLPSARQAVRRLMYWLFVSMLLTLAILIFYPPYGIGWLHPWDQLFAVPVLLFCVVSSIAVRGIQPVLNPFCFLSVFLLSMSSKTPVWLLTHLICGTAAVLVYSFGEHWLCMATLSPMPRDAAQSARTIGKKMLIDTSLMVVIAFELMLLRNTGINLVVCYGMIFLLVFLPLPAEFPMTRWELCRKSLASWFLYDARQLPGLAQSPAGVSIVRILCTVLVAALMMILLIRFQSGILTQYLESAHASINQRLLELRYEGASFFTRFRYGVVAAIAIYGALSLHPILITLLLMVSASQRVIVTATMAALRSQQAPQSNDPELPNERHEPMMSEKSETACLQLSRFEEPDSAMVVPPTILDSLQDGNDIERDSVFLGYVVDDHSPVLVMRETLNEHVHVLGDSGSGKTSRSLAPLAEQLIAFGDCSVIVIDLKADSLELLATLQNAAAKTRKRKKIRLPIKYFSNQRNKSTFAFNPMQQPFWKQLDINTQTDLLLGAAGLTYGTDYGEGFYSTANLSVGEEGMKQGPQSIAELAEHLRQIAQQAKKRGLNPEIVKAGSHVLETMKRLGSVEALNVSPATGHSADVLKEAIDLSQVFLEPQLMYFHLSSTLSPSGAPEIARLVTYLLLAAATQTERKHPVYLVIDEFQRMVASNLEYMLQLARSMGVGMILANQSMADLRKGRADLITAVEANCRLRQWFSVSSREDQERLIASSGLTVDKKLSYSRTLNDKDEQSESWSESEEVVSRLTLNDILLMNDHPKQSIVRISRGAGYAQYGGMPVIIETDYHITKEEYDRRRKMQWPNLTGSFLPGTTAAPKPVVNAPAPPIDDGPIITDEEIGRATPSDDDWAGKDLYEALQKSLKRSGGTRRRKK